MLELSGSRLFPPLPARQLRACVDKELKHINEQKWDDAPTVIVYEVEVGLGGASPVIKRLSDTLACRPSN